MAALRLRPNDADLLKQQAEAERGLCSSGDDAVVKLALLYDKPHYVSPYVKVAHASVRTEIPVTGHTSESKLSSSNTSTATKVFRRVAIVESDSDSDSDEKNVPRPPVSIVTAKVPSQKRTTIEEVCKSMESVCILFCLVLPVNINKYLFLVVDQIDVVATSPAQISSCDSHCSVLDIAQLDFQRGQYDQCILVLSEALVHASTDILNRKHIVDTMDMAILRLRCLEMRSAAFIETGQTKRAIQDCSTGLELWLSSMDATLYCVFAQLCLFSSHCVFNLDLWTNIYFVV